MKPLRILLIVIFIQSCSPSNNSKKQEVDIPNNEYIEYVAYGNTQICLPTIDGMKECYSVPTVKEKFDFFNYEGNSILAVYLNDKTFAQANKLDEITFDDYFYIYVSNEFANAQFDESILNELTKLMENNYIKKVGTK